MTSTSTPRTTWQRTAVRHNLAGVEEFRTASQIHDDLKRLGDKMGLATVYRALQAMAEAGEVDVLRTPDGEGAYRKCSDGHHHHHDFDAVQAGRGGWSVLVGDSIHNFCDGIIIAAAFLADTQLGLVTSLAIIAHEIPQEVGDYIVLLNAGFSRSKALLYNAISGLASVVGGVLGYFVVGPWEGLFPYLLVAASSSFVYVAVADLLPQLQQRLPLRATLAQLGWIGAGLVLVTAVKGLLHTH